MAILNEQPLPTFDRPIMATIGTLTPNDERKLTQLHCKEEIVKWLVSVLLIESSSTASTTGSVSGQSNLNASLSVSTGTILNDQYYASSSSTISTLVPNFEANSTTAFRDRSADLDTL